MLVSRLIFRFDFDVNFKIINNPGLIMEMLWDSFIKSGIDKKKIEAKEDRGPRRITVGCVDTVNGFSKHFNVEPININCSLEKVKGTAIQELVNNKDFLHLTEIANALINELKIDNILRSGFRIYCFDKPGKDFAETKKAFCSLYENEFLNRIEDHLGLIQDCAVVFDGNSEDDLSYHFRSGPYQNKEARRYFNFIHNEFSEQADYNLICDIDLYEKDFSFAGRTVFKYFKPLLVKTDSFTKSLLDLVKSKIGE